MKRIFLFFFLIYNEKKSCFVCLMFYNNNNDDDPFEYDVNNYKNKMYENSYTFFKKARRKR